MIRKIKLFKLFLKMKIKNNDFKDDYFKLLLFMQEKLKVSHRDIKPQNILALIMWFINWHISEKRKKLIVNN